MSAEQMLTLNHETDCEVTSAVIVPPIAPTVGSKLAVKAVLFDLGDTILNFATERARPYLRAAIQPGHARLIEMGFAPPLFPRYRRAITITVLWAMVRSWLTGREVQLVDALFRCHRRMNIPLSREQLDELLRLCSDPVCRLISVDPQALNVLSGLRNRGIKLGLISNTLFPGFAIDDALRAEGLIDFFPVRVYSSEVGYKKPDPRLFEIALHQLDIHARYALYVGDRPEKDVKGAHRAGMRSVLLVHRGLKRRSRPRPTFKIHKLDELLDLLAP